MATAAEAASEVTSLSAEADAAVHPRLQRVHLLPFQETCRKIEAESSTRLNSISPALRSIRNSQAVVSAGKLVDHDGCQFAVIKCEPQRGVLNADTTFFLEGSPLIVFDKIQFSAWGPAEMPAEDIFEKYVATYFHDEYAPFGSTNTRNVRFFYLGMVFQVGDVYLRVEASEPAGLGVVSQETNIFTVWDKTEDFEKVHIIPFSDTLPRAYEYDIFQDYLKPYLNGNSFKQFRVNERFSYQGVEFKMVACDPANSVARIGKKTTIYCEGVLQPSMRNLLSPEQLRQVSQLTPGMQMLLLSTERTSRELDDSMMARRGLFEDTISMVDTFTWSAADETSRHSTCMICLNDFEVEQECRRLPCTHVFHRSCGDEWLRRCTDCPICKANVDRALRHY
eukprot:TRINITY_DN9578_c0_g1_i1.p1 TRINITY_DN9578_c0_g1~~TRINITY_DN9578_c0_g1_i1.p1  ORF type:complete len:394 (+),score=66.52 TRINITY_DN9578_c0_g1_i1:62-1243(+)